jgi:soluble lytic murein transglycosylase-like protein
MNSVRSLFTFAFCAGLAAFAAPAAADLYSYVDKSGRAVVTDHPPDDDRRYELFLRTPDDYKLKDAAEFRNLRNPGDFRLRALSARLDPKEQAARDALNNPALAGKPFQSQVFMAAKEHNVDPALVHAVILAESNYNPNAVSEKGALGLMQVMPGTGRRYGTKEKDLRVPENNIRAGTQYLAELITLFNGDLRLAIAAYNAGENAVLRFGKKIPPFAETLAYVPRVMRAYEELRIKQ